jgi:hypothetical protein
VARCFSSVRVWQLCSSALFAELRDKKGIAKTR